MKEFKEIKKHIFKIPKYEYFLETLVMNGKEIYKKIVKKKVRKK